PPVPVTGRPRTARRSAAARIAPARTDVAGGAGLPGWCVDERVPPVPVTGRPRTARRSAAARIAPARTDVAGGAG
ncbi:hypothetical protein C7E25_24510, partial [Stenotrophomonas maltophilia]